MSKPQREKIELLSVDLLDHCRTQVVALKKLAKSLDLEFGWHYLLDMTWILDQLGDVRGQRILDAGAGTGILQWFLAAQGADVLSVDRGSRAALPLRFRVRFNVRGLRPGDLLPYAQVVRSNFARKDPLTDRLKFQAKEAVSVAHLRMGPGKIAIYNQDLKDLRDIPEASLDSIVAVSALEHNSPEGLQQVVAELMRVLKPGGILAASVNATRGKDWWHAPSSGWCFSEASLRRLFALGDSVPSNYDRYDELFVDLKNCAELRSGLAKFYSRSGKNGMPWGKWDPQYIPVGVVKIKS